MASELLPLLLIGGRRAGAARAALGRIARAPATRVLSWTGPAAVLGRLKAEVMSRRTAGLVLSGPAAAPGFLREARRFAPHLPIGCLLAAREVSAARAAALHDGDRLLAPSLHDARRLARLAPNLFPVAAPDAAAARRALAAAAPLLRRRTEAWAGQASVVFAAEGPRAARAAALDRLRRLTPRRLELLEAEAAGPGGCGRVNDALRAARGEFVALVRPSAVLAPDWLERLLRCFRRPDAGAAGPGTAAPAMKAASVLAAAWSLAAHAREREAARLSHACWVLRREALLSTGLFDPRFAWGTGEDWDYSLRLRHAGWTLYAAEDVLIPGAGPDAAPRGRDLLIEKWCETPTRVLSALP